jgi:hypothetical protein
MSLSHVFVIFEPPDIIAANAQHFPYQSITINNALESMLENRIVDDHDLSLP